MMTDEEIAERRTSGAWIAEEDVLGCTVEWDMGENVKVEKRMQAVCVHDDGSEHPSDGTLPCPIADHDHRPVQHRDRKRPWCRTCGLDQNGRRP